MMVEEPMGGALAPKICVISSRHFWQKNLANGLFDMTVDLVLFKFESLKKYKERVRVSVFSVAESNVIPSTRKVQRMEMVALCLYIFQANALRSLMSHWQSSPPSWGQSEDRCTWVGVNCTNTRVTTLNLLSMGIQGTLSSDIALLTELQILACPTTGNSAALSLQTSGI